MAQIIRRLCIALFLAAVIVYLNYHFSDSPLNWLTFLEASIPVILVLIVGYSRWIVGGTPAAQEWESLETEFPYNNDALDIPETVAKGEVLSGGEVAAVRATIYPLEDGLVIIKQTSESNKPKMACIPWHRVKQVFVPEPRGLAKCATPEDYDWLERHLRAELIVSRGSFPPFKIVIPWRYFFESGLPPTVDLQRDWLWPIGIAGVT